MHGDRVLVNLTGIDRRGRREGMIARVLERRMSRLVGRFFYELGIAYVEPDDKRLQRNVQIPPEHIGGASEGQLVVCELVVPPDTRRPAIGRILAVLGEALTPSLVVETAIHGHQLPHVFPQDVLDAAAAVPLTVTPGMLGGRVDLRALPLVTIDGEDAKDFDDAVYCESNRGGSFGRGDCRRFALCASRDAAGRRGAHARYIGVFPGLCCADVAGDVVQWNLLVEAQCGQDVFCV